MYTRLFFQNVDVVATKATIFGAMMNGLELGFIDPFTCSTKGYGRVIGILQETNKYNPKYVVCQSYLVTTYNAKKHETYKQVIHTID